MTTIEGADECHTILPLLEGTAQSIPHTLTIIKLLLAQVPRVLLFVIDGLQILDHGDMSKHIVQLVETLQSDVKIGRVK
jgi:hypothetical protein